MLHHDVTSFKPRLVDSIENVQEDASPRCHLKYSVLNAARLCVWLSFNSGVILSNKWMLHPMRFPFPISLACWHMAASAMLGTVAVRSGLIAQQELSWANWAKFCLPVGVLSAGALIFGNLSFTYLTVSFMQMLKANLPVIVFSLASLVTMVVFAAGVAMASFGEINLSAFGLLCFFCAMSCEAVRLTLVQILLQRQDLQLSSLSTLYYIMPISTACLFPLALIHEAQALEKCSWLTYDSFPALLANAAGAVLLNL